MDLNKYPVPHPQVAARIVDDAAVIVTADLGMVDVLNAVGTRVWELMDGTRSVREIASVIESEYEVGTDEATRDVQELLQRLVDAQVIVLADNRTNPLA